MDPNEIELTSMNRLFAYEKQCREIDECTLSLIHI